MRTVLKCALHSLVLMYFEAMIDHKFFSADYVARCLAFCFKIDNAALALMRRIVYALQLVFTAVRLLRKNGNGHLHVAWEGNSQNKK